MSINFNKAYYIKLGREGCWEESSIASGLLRLGWDEQDISDINLKRWSVVESQLRAQSSNKGVATKDLNGLRYIAESAEDDIWITFYGAKLWWARLAPGPMEEDSVSKYRRTLSGWKDRAESGQLLVVNDLPGRIAMLQGYRATFCTVKEHELLRRILAGERSQLADSIASATKQLTIHLISAIEQLHWKDYETLVDLVFRHAGWERVSVLGQQAKGYDLELREPLTNSRYIVQIKSQATKSDLDETIKQFSTQDFRRVFFVVHTPAPDLRAIDSVPEQVEIVPPEKLARLALKAGLIDWLQSKVS